MVVTEIPPAGNLSSPIVRCRGIRHGYKQGETRLLTLQDLELEILPGETVILTGPSGAGKSTLLNLIGGMLRVQEGQMQVLGIEMGGLNRRQLTDVRRQIRFFMPELIESLTVAQNVEVALGHERLPASYRQRLVAEVLGWVGLDSRGSYHLRHLSGSQRQRVAIARALAHRPRLLLAEYPTEVEQLLQLAS